MRRTTRSLVEWSSFRARRRSYDVHSADPESACVPASTPLGLGPRAGGEPPLAGLNGSGGGSTAASLAPSASASSASPASAAGSTAALRVGGRAPAGALGAGTGCVHAGGRRVAGDPRGSGRSITSSSASGAGAAGLMPDVGSSCAGTRGPRLPLEAAPVAARTRAGETPRRRVSGIRHSPGTKVCLSEVTAARSRHPGQFHSMETSMGNLHWPGMRLCSLSVRTRLRLHPIQVSRPAGTGAGLLPGGVGAGVPAPTAGKFWEVWA